MAKPSVGEFVRQVRQEVSKVTWPSRKETVQSVIMVFVMVAIAALFFFAVDILLAWLVQLALSFGG
ncbi:MAG: preprotein translocase subunit SecE [Rhodospirillaceae bacterium]|nr:preprotein translocase subunit SecE [Rhodospirillaceae bacterium]|tara:strand:- start:1610 stop:1807 length:198 start_codon:yes stop_codon:yes gene_type:complete